MAALQTPQFLSFTSMSILACCFPLLLPSFVIAQTTAPATRPNSIDQATVDAATAKLRAKQEERARRAAEERRPAATSPATMPSAARRPAAPVAVFEHELFTLAVTDIRIDIDPTWRKAWETIRDLGRQFDEKQLKPWSEFSKRIGEEHDGGLSLYVYVELRNRDERRVLTYEPWYDGGVAIRLSAYRLFDDVENKLDDRSKLAHLQGLSIDGEASPHEFSMTLKPGALLRDAHAFALPLPKTKFLMLRVEKSVVQMGGENILSEDIVLRLPVEAVRPFTGAPGER